MIKILCLGYISKDVVLLARVKVRVVRVKVRKERTRPTKLLALDTKLQVILLGKSRSGSGGYRMAFWANQFSSC